MARKRRKRRVVFGSPVGIRRLRQGGYPKRTERGWVLQDGQGRTVAKGFQRGCTKIRPGAAGHWIDSKRCTYNFKFPDAGKGTWYACRGYGEGIAVSCRKMKKAPGGTKSTYFDGRR
jgi:hypothetical protein